MAKKDIITKGRKKVVRAIRNPNAPMKNADGSVSTHRMAWGEGPGGGRKKYVAFPTIFPNKDNSWTDYSSRSTGRKALDEAINRGEVFGFARKKRAEKFAAGSWKQGKDRKMAMKQYRQSKKSK